MAASSPVPPDDDDAAARSFWATLPVAVLALEYLLGGLPRLSPVPFGRMHRRLRRKTLRTAPHLAPVFPFTDFTTTTTTPRSGGGRAGSQEEVQVRAADEVRRHMAFVGALMVLEAALLAAPRTRTAAATLALGLVLPAAGAWSQRRAGLPFWLPVANLALGLVVHYVEGGWGGR